MLTRHADPVAVGRTPRPPMELMLQSLPEQQREIIVATYFSGRTTREAALMLGLAPDAANARLYQAMHELSGMVDAVRPRPEAVTEGLLRRCVHAAGLTRTWLRARSGARSCPRPAVTACSPER